MFAFCAFCRFCGYVGVDRGAIIKHFNWIPDDLKETAHANFSKKDSLYLYDVSYYYDHVQSLKDGVRYGYRQYKSSIEYREKEINLNPKP